MVNELRLWAARAAARATSSPAADRARCGGRPGGALALRSGVTRAPQRLMPRRAALLDVDNSPSRCSLRRGKNRDLEPARPAPDSSVVSTVGARRGASGCTQRFAAFAAACLLSWPSAYAAPGGARLQPPELTAAASAEPSRVRWARRLSAPRKIVMTHGESDA